MQVEGRLRETNYKLSFGPQVGPSGGSEGEDRHVSHSARVQQAQNAPARRTPYEAISLITKK